RRDQGIDRLDCCRRHYSGCSLLLLSPLRICIERKQGQKQWRSNKRIPIPAIRNMPLSPTMQSTLLRYRSEILAALRHSVQQASETTQLPGEAGLIPYYGQMEYHLGWVDSHFSPVPVNPGKLLRPT